MQEFLDRFEAREISYEARMSTMLTLPEGADQSNATERDLVLGRVSANGAAITLFPSDFRSMDRLEELVQRNYKFYELRDDLLAQEFVLKALEVLPATSILYSFRDPARIGQGCKVVKQSSFRGAIDWAYELGEIPDSVCPNFLSFHQLSKGQTLEDFFKFLDTLSPWSPRLKVAVPIESLRELSQGHSWMKADPQSRIFLPSSLDGRWAWYRLRMKGQLSLNFVREGRGSSADQPYLLEWLRHGTNVEHFAAVLGDPVSKSRSPLEHFDFFKERGREVFAIRVTQEEWNASPPALEILQELGLTHAAVTAPLKALAAQACRELSSVARDLGTVNTLGLRTDGYWRGTNTDLEGLQAAVATLDIPEPIALWGGGGTLSVLRKIFPNSSVVS
jgi:hypothetical protein